MHALLWLSGLLIIIFSASCSINNIKEADLPSIVLNTFKAKFSNASNTEWYKVNNVYEVEFDINKIEHTAQIDDGGNIKMLKKEINSNELPSAINVNIKQQYKNYKVDELEKVERDMNTYYQVELNGKINEHIVFTANGKKTTVVPYWDQ